MYDRELPSCLVKQAAKIVCRAYFAVEISHHFWRVETSAQVNPAFELAPSLPTVKSISYDNEVARLKLGSSGLGDVKAARAAASESSSADECPPELSPDPSRKYAGPSPRAPSST